MNLVVVGGSDAGIGAALRARELDPDARITVLLRDAYPNFSICGIPFWLGGEVPDWRDLAHRSADDLRAKGLRLLTDTTATRIDVEGHRLNVRGADGRTSLPYDALVVAVGAAPFRPPIAGLDRPGVHVLRTMGDAFALEERIARAERAVVIGGGYVGLEAAEAFARRGLDATLFEMRPAVLPTVDPDLGRLLGRVLRDHDVTVSTGTRVERIASTPRGPRVHPADGEPVEADVVLVAAGVAPGTELLRAAGADTGAGGAVRVDDAMRTGLPDVFAAGDGVTTRHRLLGETYLPLGSTAHKQGRVAGENAAGGKARFAGILGTQVVTLFDRVVARTGLLEREARDAGFRPVTVGIETDDHKGYYPGATTLHVRLTGDAKSGRLLGGQILGRESAEVAKRVDVLAAAIHHEMRVTELNDLDLSYAPPVSAPWDPLQQAARAWSAGAVGTASPGSSTE